LLIFFNIKSEESETIINITKFGNFTANFKELPPPLPPEYWSSLFTVVVTVLIGSWLTPTIIGWRKAKKHQDKLKDYQNEIQELYKDNKIDKNDITNLDKLRESIIFAYGRGDLTKDQYDLLLKKLSISYIELCQKRIGSLKNIINYDEKIKVLDEIQSDLNDIISKEKIDKEHYDSLKNEISILYQEIFKKQIHSTKTLFDNEDNTLKIEDELNKYITKITKIYTENKLNNEHYTNLKNQISMLYEELLRNQIDSIDKLAKEEEKVQRIKELKNKINDVYSKEKINEKHYNLLKDFRIG